jgi:DNA-binding NarL/FixJ family response regulator
MMIKVLVADDHAIVRAGLKQYVSDTTDIIVADEAGNGEEALNKALKNDYDVILLDITLPGRNGLDILKQLKSQKPEVKILILTIHPEDQYAMRTLRAGASGYLTKESAPQELISAIRKVAAGGKYISSSLAEKLAFDFRGNQVKPLHQVLSDREYQIMCMIAAGKRLSDIAKELDLSVKTVSSYRSRLLRKLNLKNNTELVRYTLDNQLFT